MGENLDPLVEELRTFIWSWAEHDPDCPAATAQGPAVMDPATCSCGLTGRAAELLAKVNARLRAN